MVVVRSRAFGNQAMKQEERPFSRAQAWQTIESIRNALEPLGIDKKHTYQITFDGNGNVSVQTSNPDLERLQIQALQARNDPLADRTSPRLADDDAHDDHEVSLRAYAGGSSRPRVKRPVRVRGRSRQSSRHRTEPYPSPSKAKEAHQSDNEEDLEPILPRKQSQSFRIDDTERVVAFLSSRLKRMQQLADKKIAKAWIKGICPKKQAKFPYQNKKGEGKKDGHAKASDPEVPGWWPISVCRFIEPDHIRREERMKLCLHLLRLRPSPEQLKAWNQDKTEPHVIHRTVGWTAFLQDLAGVDIFDDLPKEDLKRTVQRQELLRQMYDVAKMEEEYQIGGIDGSDTYTWEEDEEDRKVLPTKRAHQSSAHSARDSQSRSSSASASCNRAKRARGGSISEMTTTISMQPDAAQGICRADQPANDQSTFSGPEPHDDQSFAYGNAAYGQSRHSDSVAGQYDYVAMKRESSLQSHTQAQHLPWQPTTHWGDEHSTYCSPQATQFGTAGSFDQPRMPVSTFPGRQEFGFQPHQHAPQAIQCHKVDHVPEPQFQSLPTTPMFSPLNMTMPMNFLPANCELQPEPAYSTSMPPVQYFLPANPDHAEYHPPGPMPVPRYQPQHLADRHMAPMRYHGMPHTQPPTWPDPRFASHNPT